MTRIVDLDIDTNIVNTECVSLWLCLYVFSNTDATFEAQFMKKLSNTEVELKKSIAYKKRVSLLWNQINLINVGKRKCNNNILFLNLFVFSRTPVHLKRTFLQVNTTKKRY